MKTKIENSEKSIGFIKKKIPRFHFSRLLFKKLERERCFFSCQRNRAVNHKYSSWISYEEPLQTSCLGKNPFKGLEKGWVTDFRPGNKTHVVKFSVESKFQVKNIDNS